MTSRSLARLLAPLALVVCAVALFAVVTSGGGDDSSPSTEVTPSATATPKAKAKPTKTAKKYVVQAGDTPSSIAEAEGVSVADLLAANPDADPNALTVGTKLTIP